MELIELTAEEEIMSAIMRIYALNTYHDCVDLSEYIFKPKLFLQLVKRCKNAGMIHYLLKRGRIINFPQEIREEIDNLYENSVSYNNYIDTLIPKIIRYARSKSAKCMIGGSYVILQEICVSGDLLIDELVLYLDKDIDLLNFCHKVRIRKIIKDERFFIERYSKCKFINYAPLDVLYDEIVTGLEEEKRYRDRHICAYLLHDYYITRCRISPFTKSNFSFPVLDHIFEERGF